MLIGTAHPVKIKTFKFLQRLGLSSNLIEAKLQAGPPPGGGIRQGAMGGGVAPPSRAIRKIPAEGGVFRLILAKVEYVRMTSTASRSHPKQPPSPAAPRGRHP